MSNEQIVTLWLDDVTVDIRTWRLHIQSTLQTPHYYGHHANADKSQPPGEKHKYKEMTEINPRYYGNADTFLPPSATFHLFFLSL